MAFRLPVPHPLSHTSQGLFLTLNSAAPQLDQLEIIAFVFSFHIIII